MPEITSFSVVFRVSNVWPSPLAAFILYREVGPALIVKIYCFKEDSLPPPPLTLTDPLLMWGSEDKGQELVLSFTSISGCPLRYLTGLREEF